jgi:hypothetical protein
LNNVFKKRFRRNLSLSKLVVECEKVSASLRENELDEDFRLSLKNLVNYILDFPLLKTAAKLHRISLLQLSIINIADYICLYT